ncbi:MAG: dTDP-4-dehydrorhamnose 3,5-epimerase [Rhodocyclales bacterium]|nr:dTDP-4-dehydrorhamnose 3,5-epimerase [Rhodocyclales bacterium]
MKFLATSIPGVTLIEPRVFGDERGFFYESWNARDFAKGGIDAEFVQDSHSRSVRGVLRGLHYQIRQPQGKLIRVVVGEVFDVVVDLRKTSPTCGQHVAVTLSAATPRMLWVPPGFAHGFCVVSDYAEMLYKQTAFYAPEHERSLLWSDPELAIAWPLAGAPTVSEKDRAGLPFRLAEIFP